MRFPYYNMCVHAFPTKITPSRARNPSTVFRPSSAHRAVSIDLRIRRCGSSSEGWGGRTQREALIAARSSPWGRECEVCGRLNRRGWARRWQHAYTQNFWSRLPVFFASLKYLNVTLRGGTV